MRYRLSTLLIVTIVALILMPLSYAVGYFLRGGRVVWPGNVTVVGYRWEWEAKAFTPAARLETLITGHAVHTVGPQGEIR